MFPQLCKLEPGVVKFREVMQFFADVWGPRVAVIHQHSRDTLSVFLLKLVDELKTEETYLVCIIGCT